MGLAQTMAEETHLGLHLKSLQQQQQAAPSVFPSTNQYNLTLQAILQRLHAAQVRGFPPYCPCSQYDELWIYCTTCTVEEIC